MKKLWCALGGLSYLVALLGINNLYHGQGDECQWITVVVLLLCGVFMIEKGTRP